MVSIIALAAALAVSAPSDSSLRDVENLWSEAFITGDAAYLDTLLDPAYVSVGGTGVPHDKAKIIESAKGYAATHPGEHADPMPATSTIEIKGTAGVVRHSGTSDRSVDVFYFSDGHWHAWYSQHTAVKTTN